jgi:hypothetical protein
MNWRVRFGVRLIVEMNERDDHHGHTGQSVQPFPNQSILFLASGLDDQGHLIAPSLAELERRVFAHRGQGRLLQHWIIGEGDNQTTDGHAAIISLKKILVETPSELMEIQ